MRFSEKPRNRPVRWSSPNGFASTSTGGARSRRRQLEEIERRVNAEILRNEQVSKQYMGIAAAQSLGAMALFGEKYGDTVRVVTVGDGECLTRAVWRLPRAADR